MKDLLDLPPILEQLIEEAESRLTVLPATAQEQPSLQKQVLAITD